MANVPFGPNFARCRITAKRIAPRKPQGRVWRLLNRWLVRWHGGEKVNGLLAVHDESPTVKNMIAVQNNAAAVKSKIMRIMAVAPVSMWLLYGQGVKKRLSRFDGARRAT